MHYYSVNNDLAFDLPFVCTAKAFNILWQKLKSTLDVKKISGIRNGMEIYYINQKNKNSKFKEVQRNISIELKKLMKFISKLISNCR